MEAATGDRRRPPVYQGAPAHLAAILRRYFGLHRLLIAKQEVQPSAAAHGDREHRVMGMNCAVLRFDSIFQSSTARCTLGGGCAPELKHHFHHMLHNQAANWEFV